MKLVNGFNLSKVINVFVQFNGVRKHPGVFFFQHSSQWVFTCGRLLCVLFKVEPRQGLTQCYENGPKQIVRCDRKP